MSSARTVFADTNYWIALLVPGDQWRKQAVTAIPELGSCRIVTTQEVLLELLNFVAGRGTWTRTQVADWVKRAEGDAALIIVPQSSESFTRGLELYRQREDKEYSLTDCISMAVMRERGITEVLTNDHHFVQEGFTVLLRS